KGALTYTDIAGDPVLYGNLPPREISMKDVFRSGDSSKKFKIAEGQWYRYATSYVSPAYHLLEGFADRKSVCRDIGARLVALGALLSLRAVLRRRCTEHV